MNTTTVSLEFKIANDNLSKFNEIVATKKSSLSKLIIDKVADVVATESTAYVELKGTDYEPHKSNDVVTRDLTIDKTLQCQCCNAIRNSDKQKHLSKKRFDGGSPARCKAKAGIKKVKLKLGSTNIIIYSCPRHIELAKDGYTFKPHLTASSHLGGSS